MTDPAAILDSLERLGLNLSAGQEGRVLVGPKALVTEEVAALVKKHKLALLIALKLREGMDTWRDTMTADEGPTDEEPIKLVEKVVLAWPTGEALAFSPEFVEAWEENAKYATEQKAKEEHKGRKKAKPAKKK